MGAVTLLSPKVTINSPLGKLSADEVEIKAGINAHTVASFTGYSGKEAAAGAIQVMSSDAAKLMGKAQKLGFSARTSPDTFITLNDGKKDLKLKMFLTGPTFMMNGQTIRPAYTAVSESALLNNLKLDIYTTGTGRNRGGESPLSEGVLVAEVECLSPNLATRLQELTDKIISYWEKNNKGGSGSSAQLKKQRDQINRAGGLQAWKKLLDNSTKSLSASTEWLSVLSKSVHGANREFNGDLLAQLRGATRDFQEVIDGLCSAFQMVTVPSKDGAVGYFALMNDVLLGQAKDLVLPASSILLNGSTSQDLLPIQQVLARGMPSEILFTTISQYSKQTDDGDFYIGGFPSEAPGASGDVAVVPLPSYLSRYVSKVTDAQGSKPPNKDTLGSNYSRVRDLSKEFVSQLAEKAITAYCRAVYIDLALGGTNTSISLPADVTLWPGERYRVKNAAGTEIFTGFLAGITHSFKKSVGGGGQAFTTCNFTHIQFPGFTLPGV